MRNDIIAALAAFVLYSQPMGAQAAEQVCFYVMQQGPSNVMVTNRETGVRVQLHKVADLLWETWALAGEYPGEDTEQVQICVERSAFETAEREGQTIRIHGSKHHNDFKPATIRYVLRHSPVSATDPACTGGKSWCERFGL